MSRVRGIVVIGGMAGITRIGRGGINTLMTGNTIICNRSMSSGQRVIGTVNRECSRLPACDGCMTVSTCNRQGQCFMVRVGGRIVVRLVATVANHRSTDITHGMATGTVNSQMCSG